jgi:hypothetical protein
VEYRPAGSATVGQTVTVTVDVDRSLGELEWVQLAVNKGADATTTADWVILGTQPVAGTGGRATFQWDTGEMIPGEHRVGVNVGRANAETLWWYQQPERKYALR